MEKPLGVREVAEELNYSERWVRDMLKRGEIKGSRLKGTRGKWLITRENIDNYKVDCGLLRKNKTGKMLTESNNSPTSQLEILEKASDQTQNGYKEASSLQIISASTDFISESGSHAVFLTIENATNQQIPNIYGKIIDSRTLPDDYGRRSPGDPIIPKQINLAWRTGEFVETIPAKRTRDLIIAKKLYEYPGFSIFFETVEGRKQVNMLAAIVLDIEIGTEAIGTVPLIVQIKLFRVVGMLESEILSDLSNEQWLRNLVQLFHDGEDILDELKGVLSSDPGIKISKQVPAELYFESWLGKVTNTLTGTKFKQLWYNHKIVDPYKDLLPDYISKSERAIDRLKSIIRSASNNEVFKSD